MSTVASEPRNTSISIVDPYGRPIRSLRLSVTQRCDMKCPHCHREGQKPSDTEMSPEEMAKLVAIASSMGIRKVKITGGEPLARDDIAGIVEAIAPQVREVSMTTNGTRLVQLAGRLRSAGLGRVNVSLHTLDRERFTRLCGTDAMDDVLDGIKNAVSAGLSPVKINMVVFKGENEEEIPQMIDFCAEVGAVLQLIEYESDRENANGCQFQRMYYPLKALEEGLSQRAISTSVNELHRRKRYEIMANGHSVSVEVVRAMHNTEFCANCTRIRLSSDGRLKPCLLDRAGEVDLLEPLRSGASDWELRRLFMKVVAHRKPYWS